MTDEAKALVERLEEWALTLLAACEGGDLGTDEPAALMYQARDRIEQLEREKTVVSDLWEQQKEIALDYLADCNKAADRIEALETQLESANEALRERLDICETQAREIERLRVALGFSMRTLEAEGFSDDGPTLTRIRAALAGDSHD